MASQTGVHLVVTTLAKGKEATALAQCEEVIERGLDSFIEVGNALLQIRDERLYKSDYDDFETYCRERWDMSKRHVNRLIESAEVMQNLGPIGLTPSSESVARPLAALPAPVQRKAWAKAVETAEKPDKPTAKEVTAAVEIVAPKSKDRGDSEEVCWRRGLLYRATEAAAGAEFEDWSNFKVDAQLVAAAARTAQAWEKLSGYLRKLQNEHKKKRARAAKAHSPHLLRR